MGLFIKKHLHLLNLMCQKQICVFNHLRSFSAIHSTEMNKPIELKGRFASYEQKRIINDFVTKSNTTKIDWNAFKTSILSINRGYLNEKNINGYILEACSKHKRLDLAKSFMHFIKECGQTKPNLSLELLYTRSCYASRDQLSHDDQYEIQANCKSLIKNNSQLLNNSILIESNIV